MLWIIGNTSVFLKENVTNLDVLKCFSHYHLIEKLSVINSANTVAKKINNIIKNVTTGAPQEVLMKNVARGIQNVHLKYRQLGKSKHRKSKKDIDRRKQFIAHLGKKFK